MMRTNLLIKIGSSHGTLNCQPKNVSFDMKFRPISHSWVALHPQPQGVIQFIAGAFFGTFAPTFFYHHLLQFLFDRGYTIIVLPFNFTFDHYREAGFLIKEQYEILPELIRISKLEGYNYEIYLDDRHFSWLGHSLGCKYISLLEVFSSLPADPAARSKFIAELLASISDRKQIERIDREIDILVEELTLKIEQAQQLIDSYVGCNATINSLFIKDQKSVFLAPDISDTASAIRPQFLANFIDSLGWGVRPTPKETFMSIQQSRLFNLLGLVRFKSDNIAKPTCDWFGDTLNKPPSDFLISLTGGHLKPLGVSVKGKVFNPFDRPLLQPIDRRNLEFELPAIDLFISIEK
jgi:hypothetical protein